MTGLSAEAGAWCRERPGLCRLLDGFIDRYKRYGELTPTMRVTLKEPDVETIADLAAFFGKRFRQGASLKLSFAQLEARLAQTRYQSLGGIGLLEAYQGGPLESRANAQAREEARFQAALSAMRSAHDGERVEKWVSHLSLRTRETAWITAGDPDDLPARCAPVLSALADLPDQPTPLPVFAEKVTGDPHGFDLNTGMGRHLITALAYLAGDGTRAALDTESQTDLLARFNLERDNIANFTSFYGLLGYRAGRELPLWRAAVEDGAVVNLPLREMARVDAVKPAVGCDVFVVENSTVFSALVDGNTSGAALICGHGQFKLTFLRLMDLLVAAGVRVHYAGDFDAEGLLMANRLCDRNPAWIRPWRMSVADYQASGAVTDLHGGSWVQMEKLTHPELRETAAAMKASGKAGYQEAVLALLAADLTTQFDGRSERRSSTPASGARTAGL